MALRDVVRNTVARARSAAPTVLIDGAGLSGATLIVYGAWMIYQPAGFLVAGAMLMTAAWLGAKR